MLVLKILFIIFLFIFLGGVVGLVAIMRSEELMNNPKYKILHHIAFLAMLMPIIGFCIVLAIGLLLTGMR